MDDDRSRPVLANPRLRMLATVLFAVTLSLFHVVLGSRSAATLEWILAVLLLPWSVALALESPVSLLLSVPMTWIAVRLPPTTPHIRELDTLLTIFIGNSGYIVIMSLSFYLQLEYAPRAFSFGKRLVVARLTSRRDK